MIANHHDVSSNNLKIALIALGILAVPALNAVGRLILLFIHVFNLSTRFLFVSFAWHGLIFLVLMIVLIRVLMNPPHSLFERFLSLKRLKIYGISFLLLILGGFGANIYNAQFTNRFNLYNQSRDGLSTAMLFQITTLETWVNLINGVLVAIIYLVIVFQREPGPITAQVSKD